MENTTRLIIEMLDIKTIRNIAKYCENYINYTVDYKQVNNKFGIKEKTKELAELLEYCKYMLVIKQAEIKETETPTPSNTNAAPTPTKTEVNAIECESVKSTLTDSETVKSKKKEKKA